MLTDKEENAADGLQATCEEQVWARASRVAYLGSRTRLQTASRARCTARRSSWGTCRLIWRPPAGRRPPQQQLRSGRSGPGAAVGMRRGEGRISRAGTGRAGAALAAGGAARVSCGPSKHASRSCLLAGASTIVRHRANIPLATSQVYLGSAELPQNANRSISSELEVIEFLHPSELHSRYKTWLFIPMLLHVMFLSEFAR